MSDTESPTQKSFVDIAGSYLAAITAKILPIPDDVCTTILANNPQKKVQSTIFAPLQVEHRHATEQHILPKANLTDAQPNSPSDSSSGHVYGTFLQVAPYVAQPHSAINPPPYSLHITGLAQRPRVDKPHPTSVAGTRPGAPGNMLLRRHGMVPVSPTGTTARFPRIL